MSNSTDATDHAGTSAIADPACFYLIVRDLSHRVGGSGGTVRRQVVTGGLDGLHPLHLNLDGSPQVGWRDVEKLGAMAEGEVHQGGHLCPTPFVGRDERLVHHGPRISVDLDYEGAVVGAYADPRSRRWRRGR